MAAESTARRRNALNGEWVLVSRGRNDRPWTGQVEEDLEAWEVDNDPQCHLCPGSTRATGFENPEYSGVYIFDNDFPAINLASDIAVDDDSQESELFRMHPVGGTCRVVCFSPSHRLTLARLKQEQVRAVVDAWCSETASVEADPTLSTIQIFENRGAMMGCSNPHPHGQIWAQDTIPTELEKETGQMAAYFSAHKSSLLNDYLIEELRRKERVVLRNSSFVALVPYWAAWPFETIILPKRPIRSMLDLTEIEVMDFADVIQKLTTRYDNLFKIDFPYTAGIHQSPMNGDRHDGFCMHMHFYPPLLRSAKVRKFMVGYEMLAEAQRDITPEQAATILRELPETHFAERG